MRIQRNRTTIILSKQDILEIIGPAIEDDPVNVMGLGSGSMCIEEIHSISWNDKLDSIEVVVEELEQ